MLRYARPHIRKEMRSAVRVRSSAPSFPANPVKTTLPRCSCRGLCQQYVSSRLCTESSSPALACYKWLQGAAVGAGESSGIDRLTECPGFGGCSTVDKTSPKCREAEFLEVRLNGVLRSS